MITTPKAIVTILSAFFLATNLQGQSLINYPVISTSSSSYTGFCEIYASYRLVTPGGTVLGPPKDSWRVYPNESHVSAPTGQMYDTNHIEISFTGGYVINAGRDAGQYSVSITSGTCAVNATNCTTQYIKFKYEIANNEPYSVGYQVMQNGVELCDAFRVIPGGGVGTINTIIPFNPCSDSPSKTNGLSLMGLFENDVVLNTEPTAPFCQYLTGTLRDTGITPTQSSSTTYSKSSSTGNATSPVTPPVTNSITFNPTNSAKIPFNTNTAPDSALDIKTYELGTTALYDALTRGFSGVNANTQPLHGDLLDIKTAIAGLGAGLGTNSGSGGGTNNFSDAGITNAVNRFHTDNTNLLGKIYGVLTNRNGSTNYFSGGIGTNYDSASGLATPVTAAAKSALEGAGTALGNTDYSPGGGGSLSVDLGGGYVMEFDPVNDANWGPMWALMKQWAWWLICIAYLAKICKDIYDLLQLMGTAKGITIPDFQATFVGVGGNWGATLTPVIVAAVLLCYAGMLGYITTQITSSGPIISMVASNPFSGASGAVATGLGWLAAAFPIAEAMGLMVAYVIWLFSKNVAAITFISIMRMIVGA